jgi:membrane protease YdiL (CAAX protease family)
MNRELFPEENHDYRRTWFWAVPLVVLILFLAGQLLVILPADALGLVTEETIETYPNIFYLVAGTFTMVALLFTLWIKFFERRSMAGVGLVFNPQTKPFYLRGYGAGLIMGSLVVVGILLLGGFTVETGTGLAASDLIPIFLLMLAFILQSGVEEMVFRGWMMSRLSARFGLWVGVAGNSLLFTLMHVDFESLDTTPVVMLVISVVMTLLFSIFLSILVIREKSIWGASAWHAAWNWIFITWFGLPTTGIELGLNPLIVDLSPVEGGPVWLTGGTDGPEGSILSIVVLALGCGVVLWRKSSRNETG